ncbi:MAG: alpha-1,2-fucosyltransferase [Oscillospiraceae bacterium]|nr:alpha-1,2-fucosyltransferase [Oscillospiraceae bacterium]
MKNNEAVQIRVVGGLGNQMFCYAFYEKIKKAYPDVKFIMDISSVWTRSFQREAEFLDVFPGIHVECATARQIFRAQNQLTFKYRGKGSRMIYAVMKKINSVLVPKKRKYCITENDYLENEGNIEFENVRYLDGFWQNIDHYIPMLEDLQKLFAFRPMEEEYEINRMKEIQSCNSVSVHIRRGDYVGEVLDILDTEYYRSIIRKIQDEEPDAHFFFFSNDSAYVEREYFWLKEKTIVDDNTGSHSFRDMQLMSMCKTNIIANSTFSIWAALLNQNEHRKVYYPSLYQRGTKMQDIHLPGFVKVECCEK